MQDTFTVAQDLSFAEYLRFSLYQLPRTRIIRQLFIYVMILGLMAAVTGLLAPGQNEPSGFMVVLQFLLLPVFLVLLFFVYLLLAGIIIIRFKPHVIRGLTYRFTHWGMERIGVRTEATIPWRDFKSLKETKSFFLLNVWENNVANVHVIQKRMFANSQEAESFKAFVTENLAA